MLRQGAKQIAVGLSVGLGVAFVIVGVGLLASVVPARRATAVDPMVALRYE